MITNTIQSTNANIILFSVIVYQRRGLEYELLVLHYIKHMDACVGIGDEKAIKEAII